MGAVKEELVRDIDFGLFVFGRLLKNALIIDIAGISGRRLLKVPARFYFFEYRFQNSPFID
jgi:hypothetical protein